MKLLLDSHTVIWSMDNPAKLSRPAVEAQAKTNGLVVVSADQAFDLYGVPRIW